MRLGIVRGNVIMNRVLPVFQGSKFLLVDPVTKENLKAANGKGGGSPLVVASHLSPGMGQMIAFVEGREGVNAYMPQGGAACDAYCGVIVDTVDYRPSK